MRPGQKDDGGQAGRRAVGKKPPLLGLPHADALPAVIAKHDGPELPTGEAVLVGHLTPSFRAGI